MKFSKIIFIFLLPSLICFSKTSSTYLSELESCKNEYNTYGLETDEAFNYLNTFQNEITIIDLRDEYKYKSGHIPQAINFNFFADNFKYLIYKLDRNAIYFLYSDTDDDSFTSTLMMIEMGFISPYFLKKGLKGWRKMGYPLIKSQ